MIITLGAGEDKTLSLSGFSFYYEKGVASIGVTLKNNDGTVIAEKPRVLQGQGMFGSVERFEKVVIKNNEDTEQQVEIYTSDLMFEDNRNVGVVDVSVAGRLDIKKYDLVSGRTRILAANEKRKNAIIDVSGAVELYASESGGESFPINGVLVHDNTAALYASGDGVTVRVMEYLN